MAKAAKDKDRALAHANRPEIAGDNEVDVEEELARLETEDVEKDYSGSRVIVIHPGSQNLRIGLASDALPKTLPMVVARKWDHSESEGKEGEARPRRMARDADGNTDPKELFGERVRASVSWREWALTRPVLISLRRSIRTCAPR